MSFPQAPPPELANPFDYKIPFSTPFPWSGSGPLCLEVHVSSRTNTHNLYLDRINYGSDKSNTVRLDGSASGNWPNNAVTLAYTCTRLMQSSVAAMLLGADDTSVDGVALPFALPGTNTAPSGTCTIYHDMLFSIPMLADANGRATLNLGLGVNPYYDGLHVYGQVAQLDRQANAFGVVTSSAVEHQLKAPWTSTGIGSVYNNGGLGPTGSVAANRGYVVALDL